MGAENVSLFVLVGRYAEIPIEKFCEMTGSKQLLGRFMPGTLTNPSLPYYIEPKIVLISDPEVDEQALVEATNAGIPVDWNFKHRQYHIKIRHHYSSK